jgi:hypothetical protein
MNHVVVKDVRLGGKTGARFFIVHTYQTGHKGAYFVWRKVGREVPEHLGFTENLADLGRLWEAATGEKLSGPLGTEVHFA